jgi:hypothetical protein
VAGRLAWQTLSILNSTLFDLTIQAGLHILYLTVHNTRQ